jgi:glycosyltransferase involved in cell wall biosynthesis
VFDELGGFDEGYWNGCEDVDLCLRARAWGYAVVYEPAAVLLHHESASGAERWTKVNDNLRRLATKWAGRVTPDLVVTAEGNVIPTDGRPLPDPQGGLRVALDGAAFLYHSLSQVNRELSVRLAAEHGMDVIVRSTVVPEVGPAADDRLLPVAAASAAQPPLQPQVTIRHQWPPDWSAPGDGSPVVVVQPWEFGGLPDDWIEPLTTWPDEIWCYTTWVRDCYVRSGVPADRLFVLPIGVDSERFTPDGPRLELRTTKRTRLLFVGGLIHRKGVDVLLRAYQRAFSAADDVCLVVKSFGAEGVYRHAGQFDLLREAMAQPGGPEIELINDDLDQASMAALYRACDVLVHPYRGEGFGMPIAEAMASGLAVVVTGDGAAADFCDASTALLIPSRRVAVSPGSVGLPPSRAGYWFAEPDEDALVASLRQVVQEGDTRRQRAARGRRRVQETLVWSDIAAVAAARLRALAARPARRLVADDPYHPGVRPHPLDHPRDRTVLVVAGPERPGWQQVVASAAAAVGPARDVTLVVAAEATGDRARQAVLDSLSDLLDGTDADVLVVLDAEPSTLAGLMVATDLTVAGDEQLAERAQRCGTDVVAPADSALRAWAGTTSHPSAA